MTSPFIFQFKIGSRLTLKHHEDPNGIWNMTYLMKKSVCGPSNRIAVGGGKPEGEGNDAKSAFDPFNPVMVIACWYYWYYYQKWWTWWDHEHYGMSKHIFYETWWDDDEHIIYDTYDLDSQSEAFFDNGELVLVSVNQIQFFRRTPLQSSLNAQPAIFAHDSWGRRLDSDNEPLAFHAMPQELVSWLHHVLQIWEIHDDDDDDDSHYNLTPCDPLDPIIS